MITIWFDYQTCPKFGPYKDEAPSPPVALSTHGSITVSSVLPPAGRPLRLRMPCIMPARPPESSTLVISLARVVILANMTLVAQLACGEVCRLARSRPCGVVCRCGSWLRLPCALRGRSRSRGCCMHGTSAAQPLL